MTTGVAPANGIEIFYETHGEQEGEPLLLVMGLGAQLISWPDELVDALVDRGFFVVRYDNRDVGLSTKIEGGGDPGAALLALLGGGEADVPYTVADMAADGMALLDHLGIASAHIVGASMGGMIVQAMAIGYPDRVRSLTSIMSTTGDSDVGAPTADAAAALLTPPTTTRDEAIAASVAVSKIIGSPEHFDEELTRKRAEAAYDRSFYPEGTARQLVAILGSGSRAEGLRQLDVATLVIHGDVDPLVTYSGGQRTAELIPAAELLTMEGMGHDLPAHLIAPIVEAITQLAARANA